MSFKWYVSKNKPGFFIRHQNFEGELNEFETTFWKDYEFELVEFDNPKGGFMYSLKSLNFPDRYLRHKNYRILLEERPTDPEGRELFDQDTKFIRWEGLADANGVSFESVNLENHYIRHFDYHLFIGKRDDKDKNFRGDATWMEKVPKKQEG